METNRNETESDRIYYKRPLSATNSLEICSSTNGFDDHSKNYITPFDDLQQYQSTKSIPNDEKDNNNNNSDNTYHQQNGHYVKQQLLRRMSHPSPILFGVHAIAPTPVSKEINEQKVF